MAGHDEATASGAIGPPGRVITFAFPDGCSPGRPGRTFRKMGTASKRVSSRERDEYGGIMGASANGRDGIP